MISKTLGVLLLLGTAFLLLGIGVILPPIAQPLGYHAFADNRHFLGINNAWNVLSNLFFALVGFWGLFLLRYSNHIKFVDYHERGLWVCLSLGLILIALGSSYYHLAPDNARLVWDRLPMALVFMSFIAILFSDRINGRFGFYAWPFLLVLGICSVLVWYASEVRGTGDMRFYLAIQGYTAIAALIMSAMPSHYTRSKDIVWVVLWYGLAKGFEAFDSQIYTLTEGVVSGHSLKHLAGALSSALLIRMVWKRRINP